MLLLILSSLLIRFLVIIIKKVLVRNRSKSLPMVMRANWLSSLSGVLVRVIKISHFLTGCKDSKGWQWSTRNR